VLAPAYLPVDEAGRLEDRHVPGHRRERPGGKRSLPDLFDGMGQLIVYHFMFPPEWDAGCPHCSFWADHFDGAPVHLRARDTSFVAVSRAPRAKLATYEQRMGWSFASYSSGETDFNYDFGASFTRHSPPTTWRARRRSTTTAPPPDLRTARA
jgi:predicted dithiol-disulfide oxidoreductase (DUF899 family)